MILGAPTISKAKPVPIKVFKADSVHVTWGEQNRFIGGYVDGFDRAPPRDTGFYPWFVPIGIGKPL